MPCNVIIENCDMPQEEIDRYVQRATEKYGREPIAMQITVDGDYLDVSYHFDAVPFQRVRRITGYLVGTLDRFNDAKRSEEADRVLHEIQ